MKFNIASLAVAALATQSVSADWFGNAAYNKWHETELERWLDDYSIPHPKAADRKALENLVKDNWEKNVVKPYSGWDANQMSSYLSSKGHEIKKGTEKNKDSLLSQIQGLWYETSDQANEAYNKVENWIFDSWTESQLKSFLDYHDIPNPSPRTRDSLLHTARSNYQSVAKKAGETAAYPGDWLWSQWSESDLKAWLDERGVPVPQPTSRDKLVATVRRNAKIASDKSSDQLASASRSAASAGASLSDQLLESWSDSQLKEWFDKNGIKVPQGSKRNEMVALARKNAAQMTAGNVKSSASSAYGAASTSAGNWFAEQTADAYGGFRYYYDMVLNQVGMASAEAKASLSSASSVASVSLRSASSVASVSMASASSYASVEASKSSVQGSKSAGSASKVASKSAASVASSASSAAKKATDSAKKEL